MQMYLSRDASVDYKITSWKMTGMLIKTWFSSTAKLHFLATNIRCWNHWQTITQNSVSAYKKKKKKWSSPVSENLHEAIYHSVKMELCSVVWLLFPVPLVSILQLLFLTGNNQLFPLLVARYTPQAPFSSSEHLKCNINENF